MYPDFLGIGAQKAGTTWLHKNFERHPQIWMPPEKELHFFDEKRYEQSSFVRRVFGDQADDERWRRQVRRQYRRHRTEGWRGVGWSMRYFLTKPSDRWYGSLFPHRDGLVTGEITPNYSVLMPERIAPVAELMPKAKIVLIMRNPMERAWSHAQMELVRTMPGIPCADDFRRHFRSAASWRLSDYRRTIVNWSGHFPAEQIYLGYLEDIQFRPVQFLASVYRFLGVADRGGPTITRKIHSGDVETIPTELAIDLAEIYLPELRRLDRMLEGHASRWCRMAEQLLAAPPDAEVIGYPLWDSELWPKVWPREVPPGMASGTAEGINELGALDG